MHSVRFWISQPNVSLCLGTPPRVSVLAWNQLQSHIKPVETYIKVGGGHGKLVTHIFRQAAEQLIHLTNTLLVHMMRLAITTSNAASTSPSVEMLLLSKQCSRAQNKAFLCHMTAAIFECQVWIFVSAPAFLRNFSRNASTCMQLTTCLFLPTDLFMFDWRRSQPARQSAASPHTPNRTFFQKKKKIPTTKRSPKLAVRLTIRVMEGLIPLYNSGCMQASMQPAPVPEGFSPSANRKELNEEQENGKRLLTEQSLKAWREETIKEAGRFPFFSPLSLSLFFIAAIIRCVYERASWENSWPRWREPGVACDSN